MDPKDETNPNPNPETNLEDQNPPAGGADGGEGKKTSFTQDEVNALLKKEKETSKKALLKELGVEDSKTAKEGLAKYKELLDKDKSEVEKAKDTLTAETKAREAAEKKALMAEAKVAVLAAGGKAEFLDDIITLAMGKVSENKDLTAVLTEMKPKYASFFGDETPGNDKGTGGNPGSKKVPPTSKDSIGSRLGAAHAPKSDKTYFKN